MGRHERKVGESSAHALILRIVAALLLITLSSSAWAAQHKHRQQQPPVVPYVLGDVPSFSGAFTARDALSPCPSPNPNLLGPGHFRDGCSLPAAGLNLAAPLNSPAFTGSPTINGRPLSGGSGGTASPGGALGSIQYNAGGALGGYALGPSLGLTKNGTTLDLASGAACFNLGPWSGDLTGPACTAPSLSSGAAARNLGPAGGALSGSWSSLSLIPSSLFASMGTPSGDLGGTSYSAPLVTGINGFPVSPTPPSPQSALVWNGTIYAPQQISPGINQLNGDALAGPGTGLQTITIQSQAVNNTKLALMAPLSVKANPSSSSGGAAPQDVPVTGGLKFTNGALQLDALGPSQQYTVAAGDCVTINNGFITGIVPGSACATGGDTLTADDGATVINADDGVTALLVDGAPPPSTPCNSWQTDFSVATGCNLPFLLFLKI